uniref:Uncharacterized protein n=1 Tax=Arundo donax TaxID=35708 RepID=A0A0A9EWA7_ARUDO
MGHSSFSNTNRTMHNCIQCSASIKLASREGRKK